MISKPYFFFIGLAILSLISSFFLNNLALDFPIYDTYFVISFSHFLQFCAIFFVMISINYFALIWLKKTPKKWLTILHIILQIVALTLLILSNNKSWIEDYNNLFLILSFVVFLVSIFIHIINFFISLLLKRE